MKSLIRTVVLSALAAAPFASPAPAQVGGFTDGDLYLYTRALTGNGSQDGGVLWIDPLSGATEPLVDFSFSSYGHGTMAFDSYRKRLLFYTSIEVDGAPVYGIWSADAAGALELVIPTIEQTHGLAPVDDGRLYVITAFDASAPFKWYDPANREQVLLDESGEEAYSFTGIFSMNDSCMTYDAATNALFVAYRGSSGSGCNGGSASGTTIKKLPLSADGTRVVGPVECLEFEADPVQSTEVPSNWSRGPGGMLVLVCDTPGLSQDIKPRIAMVDPVNFAVSIWAQPGAFAGADQLTAGAYSSVRGDVLVLDTLNDVLRGYPLGSSGVGSVLAPNGPLSPNPGSGELATMIEIDNTPCGGAFGAYGVGLAGSDGYVPAVYGSGCAAVGESMTIHVRDTLGGTYGLMFVGLAEGSLPFKGGTFYLGSIDLIVPLAMGLPTGPGTGDVDLPVGTLSNPAFTGVTIYMQAAFSDPGAVHKVSLTQGLRMVID